MALADIHCQMSYGFWKIVSSFLVDGVISKVSLYFSLSVFYIH